MTALDDHIARKLADIEVILANRGEAAHAAAVERAEKLSDHVLADFVRRESAPDHIAGEIASIRTLARLGELDRAYQSLERLQRHLDFLSQMVRAPALVTGIKQRRVLAERRNAGNEKKAREAAVRYSAWQNEANGIWGRKPGLSATAAAISVKKNLGCSATIDTIRRHIKEPT